jgi:hypothetical protein
VKRGCRQQGTVLTEEAAVAELTVEGNELVLHLSRFEQAEAIHGNLRIPASSVQRVEVRDDILGAVRGSRAPGTGFPGVVAIGTYRRHGGRKSFAVVHHNTRRGVRVALRDGDFEELIVGCAEPEAVAESLCQRTGRDWSGA